MYFFYINDPANIDIYTLSLHDALPISGQIEVGMIRQVQDGRGVRFGDVVHAQRVVVGELVGNGDHERARVALITVLDRKSTRLNSSHTVISYAVFCLKKKNKSQRI